MKHKKIKVGEVGYIYRGLLISKRDKWATWESKYTVDDISENILFANSDHKLIVKPNSINSGFSTIKSAIQNIDEALDVSR